MALEVPTLSRAGLGASQRARRAREAPPPLLVPVSYRRSMCARARSAICLGIMDHVLYTRGQCPMPLKRIRAGAESAACADGRKERRLKAFAAQVQAAAEAVEHLFDAFPVRKVAFILGASCGAPRETVVVDFCRAGEAFAADLDPPTAHRYSQKALMALVRLDDEENEGKRVHSPTQLHVMALVDACEGRPRHHAGFKLADPKKGGRNPRTEFVIAAADAPADAGGAAGAAWCRLDVKVRGMAR